MATPKEGRMIITKGEIIQAVVFHAPLTDAEKAEDAEEIAQHRAMMSRIMVERKRQENAQEEALRQEAQELSKKER
jgi:hypothetical protein